MSWNLGTKFGLSVICNFLNRKLIGVILIRHNSYVAKKLVFDEFGDPLKVIKLKEEPLSKLKSKEVIAKFLVASVNPADINCIQGVYPVKPTLPGTPGFEGVAEIVEVGDDVNDLKLGDRVIPDIEAFGTWRTYGIFDQKALIKVPKDVNVVAIAGISSNPSTAYRMLSDFVQLKPGDVVIQNGGNSACGQNVIQLCRHRGIISVNIVRNRPEIDQLKSYLNSLGANFVLTEEELRSTNNIFKTKECPKPKLALNAVGGKSATEVSRQLENGGIMVTYGGMSREPVSIPISSFIFKDLIFRGFWMTRWTREHKNSSERYHMISELADLMKTGELKAPAHKLVPLDNFTEVLTNTLSSQGFAGCKYLFDLNAS